MAISSLYKKTNPLAAPKVIIIAAQKGAYAPITLAPMMSVVHSALRIAPSCRILGPLSSKPGKPLYKALLQKVEAIALPPGYTLEWGGDFESSTDANKSLIPGIIPAVAIMAFIIVTLFNAFRPPLIILFTIPFALIGITAGLLGFDIPFGFMALLGAMSLSGMMIKNAIVLLDQGNLELESGVAPYEAVMRAAQSQLRPVMLAAATTVLGVIPLLQDVFWVGLAVTIMAGLTFGSVLTMIMMPVFYCMLFGVHEGGRPAVSTSEPVPTTAGD